MKWKEERKAMDGRGEKGDGESSVQLGNFSESVVVAE